MSNGLCSSYFKSHASVGVFSHTARILRVYKNDKNTVQNSANVDTHRGPIKNVALNFCLCFHQIVTDFQNSFTITLQTICINLIIIHYYTSHHTVNVSEHYLVKYKCKKNE